jgi:hypothetical protein
LFLSVVSVDAGEEPPVEPLNNKPGNPDGIEKRQHCSATGERNRITD